MQVALGLELVEGALVDEEQHVDAGEAPGQQPQVVLAHQVPEVGAAGQLAHLGQGPDATDGLPGHRGQKRGRWVLRGDQAQARLQQFFRGDPVGRAPDHRRVGIDHQRLLGVDGLGKLRQLIDQRDLVLLLLGALVRAVRQHAAEGGQQGLEALGG